MKLHYFETPNGRVACAYAKHLKLPLTFTRVDLRKGEHKTPEFLAINPNGRIPVLEDDDMKVWESNAILCHLADKAGHDEWRKGSNLTNSIRWLSWNASHFSRHAGTIFFENLIRSAFGMGEPKLEAIEEASGFIKTFAGVLDQHLKGRRYVVGDSLSPVDFSLARFLPDAKAANIPLQGFNEIERWYGQLAELPAWQNPYPA